jgi:hypothetical protein
MLLETCRESKEIFMKGTVRQVGYLLELYRDARPPEYKTSDLVCNSVLKQYLSQQPFHSESVLSVRFLNFRQTRVYFTSNTKEE